jgi:hypothetical protein
MVAYATYDTNMTACIVNESFDAFVNEGSGYENGIDGGYLIRFEIFGTEYTVYDITEYC